MYPFLLDPPILDAASPSFLADLACLNTLTGAGRFNGLTLGCGIEADGVKVPNEMPTLGGSVLVSPFVVGGVDVDGGPDSGADSP